jgi:hypothetical protein
MASSQYTKGLQKIINGNVSLLSDDLKLVLVDVNTGYTADLDVHEFLSDVSSSWRISTSANLASKTITIDTSPSPDQVMFDCADGTFTSVTGTSTEAVVLFKDTGAEGTSPLIAYFDGASVALTPNGNDVNYVISASGLLRWARA